MVAEALRCLRPAPGHLAVDCTLGGGGHALAILETIQPGGQLLGLDVDPIELRRTEDRVRASGFGADTFVACHGNFAQLPHFMATAGMPGANLIFADLGVSSMQVDDPARGFSYRGSGPLDMRMDPSRGEPASHVIARSSESELAVLLRDNADEPNATVIARLLKQETITTTRELEYVLRVDLGRALPSLGKSDLKMSSRRTFQALRIAVNDEFAALEALLQAAAALPGPRRTGRDSDLSFRRRSAGQARLSRRLACGCLRRDRELRHPLEQRGNVCQPARRRREAPVGGSSVTVTSASRRARPV